MQEQKIKNTKSGITLIALIITIIILLVLAGVVINLALGERGILERAGESKEQYEINEIIEKLELEKADLIAKQNGQMPTVQVYIEHIISKGIISLENVEDINENAKHITVNEHVFLVEKEESGNIKISLPEVEWKTTEIQGNIYNVLVMFRNEKGIKEIHYPKQNESEEETIVYANGKHSVAIDYTMEHLKTYKFTVDFIDGTSKIYEITYKKPTGLPPKVVGTPSTSEEMREGNELPFTWEQLNEIATSISNNSSITSDTAEFTLNYEGEEYIIGIGDWTTVKYDDYNFKVRILGFNHDILAGQDMTKSKDELKRAGISFEFAEIMFDMYHNACGVPWINTAQRSTLNADVYNSMKDTIQIKSVVKEYWTGYKDGYMSTCEDFVWALSSAEIWSNGKYEGGRGECHGIEGSQYKYYKNAKASWNTSNAYLKKPFVRKNGSSYNTYNWCIRGCGVASNAYAIVDSSR